MRSLSTLLLTLASMTPSRALAEPELAQFREPPNAGWKSYDSDGGIVLERRTVPGSAFFEHRATVTLAASPQVVADDLWKSFLERDMDSLKRRDILRQEPNELLLYDQIRTPVVSDRDYTMRVRRIVDAARGRIEIRCESANEMGPPTPKDLVRVPIMRGGWMIASEGSGTRLTYYAFSEPGGRIAAFLARRAQAKRSMADVRRMVQRLGRLK